MKKDVIFWDVKNTASEIKRILRDESHPRFVEFAALLLARTNEPKKVFSEYIDRVKFCKYWRKIKARMRQDKWNNTRIIFWDEIYKAVYKEIDKRRLKLPDVKRAAIDDEIYNIGKKVKEARKRKGWTQGDLAEKSGFSQQTISFVEKGYVNISFITLKKIAGVLGLEIVLMEKDKPTYSTFSV